MPKYNVNLFEGNLDLVPNFLHCGFKFALQYQWCQPNGAYWYTGLFIFDTLIYINKFCLYIIKLNFFLYGVLAFRVPGIFVLFLILTKVYNIFCTTKFAPTKILLQTLTACVPNLLKINCKTNNKICKSIIALAL